jgi:sec-independent protein translocase protein TatB
VIDLGISKLALIGAVALIVVGPEKLPKLARTVGMLLGKAQRYVADVKSEVQRSMELEELQRMKSSVETAVGQATQAWQADMQSINPHWDADSGATHELSMDGMQATPNYQHPKKNWRIKRQATPQWYKRQAGVRTHVQSGAARVARFRPSVSIKKGF